MYVFRVEFEGKIVSEIKLMTAMTKASSTKINGLMNYNILVIVIVGNVIINMIVKISVNKMAVCVLIFEKIYIMLFLWVIFCLTYG